MLVKDIMTRDVVTIYPDATLKEVGVILKEKRISGIPVVDKDGKIVGIITLTDMLKILSQIYKWREIEKKAPELKLSECFEKEKLEAKVRNIMTKNVFTLEEDRTLEDIMRLMFDRSIHTIPVTKDGSLVGIIGKRDLVYACF